MFSIDDWSGSIIIFRSCSMVCLSLANLISKVFKATTSNTAHEDVFDLRWT